jgi:hypothetical protein
VLEFAVPVMPSKDLDATLSFYERLGFEKAGEAPSELNYLIVRRGGVQLHFYDDPDVDPLTTSFSCYVFTGTPMPSTTRGTRSDKDRSNNGKSAAGAASRHRLRDA